MQVAIIALSALIGFIYGLQQGNAWSLRDKNSASDFDAINNMLVKMVPSDDLEANMALIKETYATKVKGKRDSMVKALEKLVALETIASADKCNHGTYELLHELDLGTRGKALVRTPVRRIDSIVRHYAIEHSNFCYELYPGLVDAKMAEVDPKHAEYVKQLDDELGLILKLEILANSYGMRRDVEECGAIRFNWDARNVESLSVLNPIKKCTALAGVHEPDAVYLFKVKNESTGQMVVNKAKITELFNKYVYVPCLEVNEKVAEELLDPIRFGWNVQRNTGVQEQCSKTIYYRVILGYCREFARNKKFTQMVLNRLIESI